MVVLTAERIEELRRQAEERRERARQAVLDGPYELRQCPVDGIRRRYHPQCVECLIMVGPDHYEERLDPDGRCESCADFLEQQERRRRLHATAG